MSKISIKEQRNLSGSDDFSVVVSFNDSDEFDGITVHDPLTPENKAKLEWHFEHYVSYPYLKTVEPSEAFEIIRQAGENLFAQLFSQPAIFSRYQQIIQNDFDNLVIEISGSPEFHSLHWEALKDVNLPSPLALDAQVIRKDLKPQNFPADVRETTTINLLVVSSRPAGRRDVGYRTISRPLVELLRNSRLPVKLHILRPATYESLDKHLDEVGKSFYQVVHFDVHGALLSFEDFERIEKEKRGNNLTFQIARYGRPQIQPYEGKDAFLFFDLYRESETKDDDGFCADPVSADELANLLLMHGVPLIILNACQSAKELGEQEPKGALPIAEETSLASHLMRAGAQMVLAMSYSVTVTAAKILMENLYREIFRGKNLHQAIKAGRGELYNRKLRRAAFNYEIPLEDWLLPVVYQKRKVELKTKTLTAREEEVLLNEFAEVGKMPEVKYGFHGRDIDILNIERRVLLKNNILLIRGMGGAGKTTLLNHLAWWWRATGFVRKVFYFGYDEKAYTRQEIMFKIAESLYDKYELATFQAMDERVQMQKLAGKLRNERHLLILDNLESIQGGFFAVKNTLPPEEQTRLKDFLAELHGTDDAFQEQTIVLLGSRNAEEWLADRTFRKNLYDLGGLDRESATQFAEEILRQNEVLQYRGDEDFKKLLKLLAGFPLPMKVIFENLKRQSPMEVLDALKAGDVDLSTGTAEDKTADILKCIEYSHSNIAPEKQELLLCLAPFTSVVNREYFHLYVKQLQRHEALKHLRHELWDEVFAESVGRGLMSQHEELPLYYLQPTLPYFLKTQWRKAERNDFKQAVLTAFRDHYNLASDWIYELMKSNAPDEKMGGQILANVEFENIDACLNYSLAAQDSISNPYYALSEYYTSINNHQAGLKFGQSVLEKMKGYSPELLAGDLGVELTFVLQDIGVRYSTLMKFKEATDAFLEVLERRSKIKSLGEEEAKRLSISIFHNLGMVEQSQRNWAKAEDYFQRALKLMAEFNIDADTEGTLMHLGINAFEQHEFEKAEKYFLESLQIRAAKKDIRSQAKPLNELGLVAIQQKEWEKARNYFEQALIICQTYNDEHLQALVSRNLGIVFYEMQEWDEAERCYLEALEIWIATNDRFSQAMTFHELGMLAQVQSDWKRAEGYYLQAVEVKRVLQNYHSLALTLMNLAVAKKAQNKLGESLDILLETLQIYVNYNDRHYIMFNLSRLQDLWEKIGDDDLLSKIGKILGMTAAQVRELFEKNIE